MFTPFCVGRPATVGNEAEEAGALFLAQARLEYLLKQGGLVFLDLVRRRRQALRLVLMGSFNSFRFPKSAIAGTGLIFLCVLRYTCQLCICKFLSIYFSFTYGDSLRALRCGLWFRDSRE